MSKRIGKNHLIIPDPQVKPDVDTDHLEHVGNYIAEKQPDVVICLGDFADMPSLNSHTKGQIEAEGTRYEKDIQAVKDAMSRLVKPFKRIKGYKPEMIFTLGNHEDRINRTVGSSPFLDGKISLKDLEYEKHGWNVIPFLKVKKVDGIEYAHYFVSGAMGRPVSSAKALLTARHCSAVMGHVQFTDIAFHPKSGHIGIFAGICYTHDEKYLGHQGNADRRQIVMLHEVHDGQADPMLVSLEFLKRKYS